MRTAHSFLKPILRLALALSVASLAACGGGDDGDDFSAAPLVGAAAGHAERLQEIRIAVGLPPLKWDTRLATAAQAHADYQRINNVFGHPQNAGMPGFTGSGFSERAAAAGYPNAFGETLMGGHPEGHEAGRILLVTLLSSQTHRAYLLSRDAVDFGLGGTTPLTTLLGRGKPTVGEAPVLYPYNGQTDVPTGHTTAARLEGMPISMGGRSWTQVTATNFYMREVASGQEVAMAPWPTLGTGIIFFTPMEPLRPGTQYEYTLTGTLGRTPVNRTVRFTTQG